MAALSRASFTGFITRNPVILKELRGRMRGWRAFAVLSLHVLVLSIFVLSVYAIFLSRENLVYGGSDRAEQGKVLFGGVMLIELLMGSVIAISLTSGAISGERERQTYDLLRTTLLSARGLVWGKLAVALMYVLVLLLTALPVQSVAFLFGGVANEELVIAPLMLLTTAFFCGALGMFCSALLRRTLWATVLTYALLGLFLGGPILIILVLAMTSPNLSAYGLAFEIALFYLLIVLVSLNPVLAAIVSESVLESNHTVLVGMTHMGGGVDVPYLSPWLPYTLCCLLTSMLLVVGTMWLVRRPER